MYQLTKDNNVIVRVEDGLRIPMVDGNQDYYTYLEWLEIPNNTPEPYVEPPIPVPYSITQRQMRLTLLSVGIYDQVEAAIEAMEGIEGKAAKITWTWAQEIKRDDPLLLSLATSFNLTEEDVDNMFRSAASI